MGKGKGKKLFKKIAASPLTAYAVEWIPFGIGSLASNLLNEVNGTKKGEIDKKSLGPILIQIVIYLVLGILLAKGVLSEGEVNVIKETIEGIPIN